MNVFETLFTPQAGYLRELARETELARKEYNLALSNYRALLEQEAKELAQRAYDELAKRGMLTPSAAARIQAQLQRQQLQEMSNAYAQTEFASAAAEARKKQLESMARYIAPQEALQFGKGIVGTGLGIAGTLASGGMAGPIMAGIGAGLSGLDLTNLALERYLQSQQRAEQRAIDTLPFRRLSPQQIQNAIIEKSNPYSRGY